MKSLQFYKGDSEQEVFNSLLDSLQESIADWSFFVDWNKVKENVKSLNTELNILNSLIGSQTVEEDFIELCKKYPEVKKALPLLIAVRNKKLKDMPILVNRKTLETISAYPVFEKENSDYENLKKFFIESGLKDIFLDKTIKNLVDYTTGVEVGMDTNARKNRTGTLMEKIVEEDIKEICQNKDYEYGTQMTQKHIKEKWNIEVPTDKAKRCFDLVLKTKKDLIFFEVNFYGSSGSKLKATAGEYVMLNEMLNNAGFKFIWITDGAGWKTEHKHLEDAFGKNDYIFNLSMIKKGVLEEII